MSLPMQDRKKIGLALVFPIAVALVGAIKYYDKEPNHKISYIDEHGREYDHPATMPAEDNVARGEKQYGR